LWLGDYDAAAKTAVVLEQRGVPNPLLYKVMLEVIQRDEDSHIKTTRLFRTLLGKNFLPSQAVLLEFVCYLISSGHIQEAFDNLEGYVSRPPFKYNAVIHGYYGFLAVALWIAAEAKRQSTEGTTAAKSNQLLKAAERHLKRARELDPTCEMYHRNLVQVIACAASRATNRLTLSRSLLGDRCYGRRRSTPATCRVSWRRGVTRTAPIQGPTS